MIVPMTIFSWMTPEPMTPGRNKVKNFLISHHSPLREDTDIETLKKNISINKVKFASENEVIEF